MMQKNISAIVFDVGRVLIDFSYDEFFAFLMEQGAHIHGVDDFIEQTKLHAYEHGHISDDEFLNNLNNLLSAPLDTQLLKTKWLDLFAPMDDMQQLADRLKTRYQVYLLSNTSPLHWQHVISHYRLADISHGMLASYEVGIMKPAPAIFRVAEQRFELRPATTVFIDDIADNAEAARQCGWRGIHHTTLADTWRQLQEMGVILD